MSGKMIETLAMYFNVIGEKETEIDDIRKSLLNDENYSPINLFMLLDEDNKTFISLKDLKNFLQNTSYKEESLRLFIHCFDKNGDFALDYEEFCNFTGSDPDSNSNEDKEVTSSIKNTFLKLVLSEIELVDVCGEISSQISKYTEFTTYGCFLAIDVDGKRYIDSDSLRNFLSLYGYNTSNADKIIWRLDTDGDMKLCYEEFNKIFAQFNNNKDSKSVQEFYKKERNNTSPTNNYVTKEGKNNNNAVNVDVDQVIEDENSQYNRYNDYKNNDYNNYQEERNNSNNNNENLEVDEVVINENQEEDNNQINNDPNLDVDEVIQSNTQQNVESLPNKMTENSKRSNQQAPNYTSKYNKYDFQDQNKDQNNSSSSSTHFKYGSGHNADTELNKLYKQNEAVKQNTSVKQNPSTYSNTDYSKPKISDYNPPKDYTYKTKNDDFSNEAPYQALGTNKNLLSDTYKCLNIPMNKTYLNNQDQNDVRPMSNSPKLAYNSVREEGLGSSNRFNNSNSNLFYGSRYNPPIIQKPSSERDLNTSKYNFEDKLNTSLNRKFSPNRTLNSDNKFVPRTLNTFVSQPNYSQRQNSTTYNLRNKRVNSPPRYKYSQPSPIKQQVSPLRSTISDLYTKYLSPERKQGLFYSSIINDMFDRTYKSPVRSQYRSPIRSTYEDQMNSFRNRSAYPSTLELTHRYTSPMRINQSPKRIPLEQTISSSNFAYYLEKVLTVELQSESIKEQADIAGRYSMRELFRLFDNDDCGYISLIDFKKTLCNEMEVFPGLEELNLLFKKHDRDNDGKLNYAEFISIFSPAKNNFFRESNNLQAILNRDYYMIERVILRLIEGEKVIEKAKVPITSSTYFNSFEIFELIKNRGMAYFTSLDLKNFMQVHGYSNISYLESELLFKRFDKSNTGKVYYRDFLQEVISR